MTSTASPEGGPGKAARPRVGFVGLGNIGLPMARCLVGAGFDVAVYDVREQPVRTCVDAGAHAAASPREAAEQRDVVGIAVVDDAQVREVVLGADGVLAGAGEGTRIAVHSTVLPTTAQELAAACAEAGVGLVDAPVSGGDEAAERGELAVIVGGADDDVAACRPVLEALGAHVFHVGAVGAGEAAKFANQLMTFANQTAAVEAMRLAKAFGLREEDVVAVVNAGTGDSWCLRHWGFFDRISRMYDENDVPTKYRPWRKDMWDIVTVAREQNVNLPLAGLVAQIAAPTFEEHARDASG